VKYFFIILISLVFVVFGYYALFHSKEEWLLFQKESVSINEGSKVVEESKVSDLYISPISIDYLRSLKIESKKIEVVKFVSENSLYKSYLVYYYSEGDKIFSQLTVPKTPKPEKGYPVIIFNHGYIPPKSYNTFYNYSAYVDYLARNGFIVLKIDMRGHGNSEGTASGTYFSSTYLKDVLSAKSAIQKFEEVDANNIGLWGHSMSGNLVLRTLLVDNTFKAGVIWAGAVYSYEDFYKYRISDTSYSSMQTQPTSVFNPNRENSPEIAKIRSRDEKPDFSTQFWKSISLTENIRYLETPIQIHHSINDTVVNVGYSRDLVEVLETNKKAFEYYEYPGGGHNITGVYFNQAMQKTVNFFQDKLK